MVVDGDDARVFRLNRRYWRGRLLTSRAVRRDFFRRNQLLLGIVLLLVPGHHHAPGTAADASGAALYYT